MMPISVEQTAVINQLSLNKNVVVDSVAGSGKTTCNLHIAKHFPNMNILLLTYNAKLRLETQERASELELSNIEVHTYHSFCTKNYEHPCFDDIMMKNILKYNKPQLRPFLFDMIVLDEAQDITVLYYELICKIYTDNNNKKTKLCLFGDKNQSIFSFNGSDQRYIEYAPDIFNFNLYGWSKCNLSVSFRVTYEMSLFINKCLLQNDRIISTKITGNKPRYIICDTFDDYKVFDEVKYYLYTLKYDPSDIFILAPSVNNKKCPIRKLENRIKQNLPDVMVYVPTGDDEKLNKKLLEDKLVFSTFHQTKGLERKVVIVFGFDESYFKFYKRDCNPHICPNELYVATTRGKEHLTIIHHYNNNYLPFINVGNISKYCTIIQRPLDIIYMKKKDKDIISPVTDIIKFLQQPIIDYCYNELEIIKNDDYIIDRINIPVQIDGNTTESVSEITGIAIPILFEYKLTNNIDILERLKYDDFEKTLKRETKTNKTKISMFIPTDATTTKNYNLNNININTIRPDELLYLANCWNSYKSGFLFKVYQIDTYDWLDKLNLNKFMYRFAKLNISKTSKFEDYHPKQKNPELSNRILTGYIDCVDTDNNVVYEFKCVKELKREHYLQLSLYMYLYELHKIEENITASTKYILFNIITNENIQIKCEFQKLKKMVETLIRERYSSKKVISDVEFLNNNKAIYKQIKI